MKKRRGSITTAGTSSFPTVCGGDFLLLFYYMVVWLQGMKTRMGGLAKKLGIPVDGFGGGT